MKKIYVLLIAGSALASTVLAEPDLSKLPPAAKKEGVTYEKDIKPILEASCFRCHGSDRPKAGLRLNSLEGVLKGSKDGKVIVPGKSRESQLVIAVARLDDETAMPPKPRPGRGPGRSGPGGPGSPGGPNGPGDGNAPHGGPGGGGQGGPGGFGPPPKPLTPEQVGLIRAWVDQGAK